ncbi:hypothetical protein KAFR_0L01620 [Kazachstania africana CBS 2517]|uniref:Uncharacterized protein n=1 Tax=Kazachstania africana (strain ATCC 22294 / BCRC 22015 / CBS 2517 / CECT 1963 / NBRC 1671 / NRRL Y-8276) TaxID=1071382 RepID=H2B2C2_KAZAF|nr:hypothetical protein KAFR_0L01620 [Kazachstania africana CBS 2517]CCF60772.1 hypothetical protein KAFR_0L01620 [Kazachstania africana CBS 2517]
MPAPKSALSSVTTSHASKSSLNHHVGLYNNVTMKSTQDSLPIINTPEPRNNILSSSNDYSNDSRSSTVSNENLISINTNNSKNPSSWDPKDDILLRHLKEVKNFGWKEIANYFQNRTPNACQFRWRRLKSGNLKSNKTALIDVNNYNAIINALDKGSNLDEFVKENSHSGSPSNALLISPYSSNISVSNFNATKPPKVDGNPSLNLIVPSINHVQTVSTTVAMKHSNSNGATYSNTKFLKPRSYSHSVTTRPKLSQPVSFKSSFKTNDDPTPDEENIGFIPKIIVRSRRSSFTPHYSSPNLTTALNTTLVNSKSRKNSFSVYSRRSSFNFSSNNNSRKSSIINISNNLINQKKDSIIKAKELHQFPSTYTFFDKQIIKNHQSPSPSPYHHHPHNLNFYSPQQVWTVDEDQLLIENSIRNLSIKELSILLKEKSEVEIKSRINFLNDNKNGLLHSENIDPLHSDEAIEPIFNKNKITTNENRLPGFKNISNDVI